MIYDRIFFAFWPVNTFNVVYKLFCNIINMHSFKIIESKGKAEGKLDFLNIFGANLRLNFYQEYFKVI